MRTIIRKSLNQRRPRIHRRTDPFNLFLQVILKEVFQHGQTNGVSFITAKQMQWTLHHLKYANDICLIADPPEAAQELLTRLVTVLLKYGLKIAQAKTVWMHVGGGDLPEKLALADEQVKRHLT